MDKMKTPPKSDYFQDEQTIEAEMLKAANPNQKYIDVLNKFETHKKKLDVTSTIQPPQIAIALKNVTNDKFATIGSLGDFSLWTGKAKVGKSYAMRMAVVSALSNDLHLGRFKSQLPKEKRGVLFIDTEQSDYHVLLGAKRICEALNVKSPEGLQVYGFRGTPHADLRAQVEALIYTTENLGLVIIDGIVDLIGNINDQDIANEMSTTIGRWTKTCNIHAMVVLHENKGKGDDNARGAIGTWLTNKAETVMNVSNCYEDKTTKLIKAIETRNAPPEDFYFKLSDNGTPIEADAPPKKQIAVKPIAMRGEDLKEDKLTEMVKELFITPLNSTHSLGALESYLDKLNAENESKVLVGALAIRRLLNYLVTHNYLKKRQGTGIDAKCIFYELTSKVKKIK
jgi:hypothetical protein